MEDLIKQFPVLETYTYLNTASCGLLSTALVDWRRQNDEALLAGGSVFRDTHKPHIARIREAVIRYCKAQPNEVALVPNFSFGFNTILEGVPKGQKVLLLRSDYPSVNWAIESRDFEICYAEIDGNLEGNIEAAIAQHRPDIFAFSIVQYLSGIKIDFEFLKQLKAYNPNLLLMADGTQYFGTEAFDFGESALDVVGCSAYKWMLAGYGNGFFMVKEAAQKRIYLKTIGFNSADAVYSAKERIPFMKRLEPGHLDTLNYGSLEQAILYLETVGTERISAKLTQLSEKMKTEFSALGLLDASVVDRTQHSTIFNIQGDETVFQKLTENNIICSQRGKGIRFSPHFYNSEADLDKLIALLK